MNTYYLRCIEQDVPSLIQLGHVLGVLQTADGVVSATGGGAWSVVGPILSPSTEEGVPGEVLKDENGNIYWHANLRTPFSLREKAEQLAINHPEISEALGQVSRFFVVDEEGNASSPKQPVQVFL